MKIYLDKKMNIDEKCIIEKSNNNHYTIYVPKSSFDNILALPRSDADFAFTSRKKESQLFFAYIGIDHQETIDLFTDSDFFGYLTFKKSIYI